MVVKIVIHAMRCDAMHPGTPVHRCPGALGGSAEFHSGGEASQVECRHALTQIGCMDMAAYFVLGIGWWVRSSGCQWVAVATAGNEILLPWPGLLADSCWLAKKKGLRVKGGPGTCAWQGLISEWLRNSDQWPSYTTMGDIDDGTGATNATNATASPKTCTCAIMPWLACDMVIAVLCDVVHRK